MPSPSRLGPVYWPVHYADYEGETSGMALFDNEELAKGFALILANTGMHASVSVPVRLSLFNTHVAGLA